MTKRQTHIIATTSVLLLGTIGWGAQAQQTPVAYNIAGIADFTGPFADVSRDWMGCRRGVVDWWNDEVGKSLGVALRLKDYDARYDVAQTASLWPGIKSELNPIAVLGLGGPDVNALQQRLPDDKIPLVVATAGYGFSWKGNNWTFNVRPTYPHELAAFYTWRHQQEGGKAPIKLGLISSEVSPAYVDIHRGVEKFAKDKPQILQVVETIYTEAQPTDLTQQVGRLLRRGATILQVVNNTASVVAAKRALQSLGRTNVPIIVSAHNGLLTSGAALGDLSQLEGSFEVHSLAMSTEDDTPARAFYQTLRARYNKEIVFTGTCVMGMAQALPVVRAIEAVVRENGADKVTGERVRQALVTQTFAADRMFGMTSTLKYNNDAPFPTAGMTINIATVDQGKYKLLEQNVPVPHLNQW